MSNFRQGDLLAMLDPRVDMAPVCNENGVYEPHERLFLPRSVKGWQGMDMLEIEIANLGGHWIWSTGLCFFTGDCAGSFSPLADVEGRRAPTRDDAILSAAGHLWNKIGGRDGPEATAMRNWLARFGVPAISAREEAA